MKLRIILALAIIFLLPTSVIAQTQGDPVSFNLSDDHTLDAFVTSSLVWEEGVDQLVKINFTMSDFKENNSEIHIQILQIFAIESGGGGELLGQNATEKVMTVANSSVEYSDSLQSPRAEWVIPSSSRSRDGWNCCRGGRRPRGRPAACSRC